MSKSKYLIGPRVPIMVPGFLSEKQSRVANTKRMVPCMTSPNITPNKKGKVTMVKIAGLTSLNAGIPYVLTIS